MTPSLTDLIDVAIRGAVLLREKVILGLGFSGDPRALDVVAAAMKDPDDQVREKAVTAYTFLLARRR
jgi:HEAT repeat protein